MKNALLILLTLFALTSANSQTQWILQPTPVTSTLTKIVFIDTLNGWAAGDSGKVIHTTNGGANWINQDIHIDINIDDLFFLNSSTGWVLANDYILGTYIFKTTDSGISWNSIRFPDNKHFYSTICFNNENTGYLGGNEGRILKTTDTGSSWEQCFVDSSFFYRFPIKKITFFNERIGTAVGGAFDLQGVLWQTTNAGSNWSSYGVAAEPVFRVMYIDSLNILGVGGDHEFGASRVRSSNGGSAWDYSLLNIFGTGYSLDSRISNEYWIALGFSQTLAFSSNAGANWHSISSPDSASVFDIVFKTPTAGWCCADGGRVYKYNAKYTGVNSISSEIPETFYLSQNYPNPFNPSTKIKFEIPYRSDVKLEVYNVLGKEVKKLVDRELKAGSYEAAFEGSDLPSGMYYYSLQLGSLRQTKKMLLLK